MRHLLWPIWPAASRAHAQLPLRCTALFPSSRRNWSCLCILLLPQIFLYYRYLVSPPLPHGSVVTHQTPHSTRGISLTFPAQIRARTVRRASPFPPWSVFWSSDSDILAFVLVSLVLRVPCWSYFSSSSSSLFAENLRIAWIFFVNWYGGLSFLAS